MLDGDPAALPKKGGMDSSPAIFSPYVAYRMWQNGWMDKDNMPLGTEIGLGPGHIVL